MRAASFQTQRLVSLEGLKKVWVITDDDVSDDRCSGSNTIDIDGVVFVRISGEKLSHLVKDDLPDVPQRVRYISKITSKGLRHMMELRDTAQAESLQTSACTLIEPPSIKKPKPMPRSKIQQMRDNPSVISIDVPVQVKDSNGELQDNTVSIQVLRPVQKKDPLFVALVEDQIAAVIYCLRSFGFDEPSPRMDLPSGITRSKRRGYVVTKHVDNAKQYRCFKSLDDAIEANDKDGFDLIVDGAAGAGDQVAREITF